MKEARSKNTFHIFIVASKFKSLKNSIFTTNFLFLSTTKMMNGLSIQKEPGLKNHKILIWRLWVVLTTTGDLKKATQNFKCICTQPVKNSTKDYKNNMNIWSKIAIKSTFKNFKMISKLNAHLWSNWWAEFLRDFCDIYLSFSHKINFERDRKIHINRKNKISFFY